MAVEKKQNELERAEALATSSPEEAMELLFALVRKDVESGDEVVKVKEQAILNLGGLLAKHKRADDLGGLIRFIRPFLSQVSKAKAAKLVRTLVDLFLDMNASTGTEVGLCQECIAWAKDEKRTFLRQNLESRLVVLYLSTGRYNDALQLGSTLLRELKKLDDKALLLEVQLSESKAYFQLSNPTRSRAALTSARTTASGIYCPPKLQAALDLQSGVLHAHELDFKTGYSYFYEAFEGFDSADDPRAFSALKYMLLCKILLNVPEDVQQLITGKLALKYTGPSVDAMGSVATACRNRSLSELKECLARYEKELGEDHIIQSHLGRLYDQLLEQNLLRIIEPFSRVQVAHVAKLINLDLDVVERKLSQMILDKTFHGILDQGDGVLEVFEEASVNQTYDTALETVHSIGRVVDGLYHKAKKLS